MRLTSYKMPWIGMLLALVTVSPSVFGHGERALEPFVRMRTIQWYDIEWSKTDVNVNDELTLKGKFHVAEDWPSAITRPDSAYLNVASPSPVLVRKAVFINGVSVVNAVALRPGGDYEFSIVLKARIPARYHIHPMMNVKDVGVIVGPGEWIKVSGAAGAFTNPVTTVSGKTIDLETYGTANGVAWHFFWLAIAGAWVIWWIRRPQFLLRNRLLRAGQEDRLITQGDRKVATGLLIGTLLVVAGGYTVTEAKYPNTIPLQAGRAQVDPLPAPAKRVTVTIKGASYREAERMLIMTLEVTNGTAEPVRLGEFNTATVRFINPKGGKDDPGYPAEIIARTGLSVEANAPIPPGETKTLKAVATDAAFATQRLSSITKDADSRFGGLMFFYGTSGARYVTSVAGPVIPVF